MFEWVISTTFLSIDFTFTPLLFKVIAQPVVRIKTLVESTRSEHCMDPLSNFDITVNIYESKSIWASEKSLWQMGSYSSKILRYTQCRCCSQRLDRLQWHWWQNIIKSVTKIKKKHFWSPTSIGKDNSSSKTCNL